MAQKLTSKTAKTMGSILWMLSNSSAKRGNSELSVLQISYMAVGLLVNSDAKKLQARDPGWPLFDAMLC